MELLIPLLIMVGLAALIVCSTIMERRKNRRKEKPEERPHFSHPPMDLRLKHDPCERCCRFEECGGVDRDNCEVAKGG